MGGGGGSKISKKCVTYFVNFEKIDEKIGSFLKLLLYAISNM